MIKDKLEFVYKEVYVEGTVDGVELDFRLDLVSCWPLERDRCSKDPSLTHKIIINMVDNPYNEKV